MNVATRKTLLTILVGIFLAQTWLVYSDPIGRAHQFTDHAMQGRALWHRHNCQSCHQIYGFGGFLGPDLTNVATRLGGDHAGALETRLGTILTSGSDRMPPFELDEKERSSMAAFFRELDKTGVGQAGIREARPPRQLFAEVVTAALAGSELEPIERLGFELMGIHGCIDCHLPNQTSSFRSTDLTRLVATSGEQGVREILSNGRPEKGMPNLGLSSADRDALLAFLVRLESIGSTVGRNYEASTRASGGSLADLPWFEYPR